MSNTYIHIWSVVSIAFACVGIGMILGSQWSTHNANEWLEENDFIIVKNNSALSQCYIDYQQQNTEQFVIDDQTIEKYKLNFNLT